MSGAVWALSHAAGEVSCHGGEDSETKMLSRHPEQRNGISSRGLGDHHHRSEIPRVFSCHVAQPGALELRVTVEVFRMGSDHVPPIPTGP